VTTCGTRACSSGRTPRCSTRFQCTSRHLRLLDFGPAGRDRSGLPRARRRRSTSHHGKGRQRRDDSSDFGWNDIGSWAELFELTPPDTDGNVALGSGRVLTADSSGNLVYADGRAVALVGVQDWWSSRRRRGFRVPARAGARRQTDRPAPAPRADRRAALARSRLRALVASRA